MSVAATLAVQLNELLNVDFSYTCPSPRRIANGNDTKEKKGSDSRLSAAHLCLIFILLFRAFARLVASTTLVLRPTLSVAEADDGFFP